MNGIYIHIPFCLKKCAYCDFVSYTDFSSAEEYADALISEMQKYKGVSADTLYIGGGTPTSLPSNLLQKIIFEAKKCFILSDDAEITVESNPKTADYEYFKSLKKAGVNRISLGVQSLNDGELSFLGRVHSADDAFSAIDALKQAGFINFNVDVMFGLKMQTEESVFKTLKNLISLSPTHFSCYSLIVEENTPFGKLEREGKLSLMDEDAERELFGLIVKTLNASGFEHYEISNFAKEGFRSRHNTKYWKREPYIGLGCASHSFWMNERFFNPDSVSDYIYSVKNNTPVQKEKIQKEDAISEFMILGLRMTEGVSKSEFFNLFGLDLKELFSDEIAKLRSLSLINETEDRIFLTPHGLDVSNEVFIHFLR